MQLSNLKATVTHQKCTIISDFDLLRIELWPYGSFFDDKIKEQLSYAHLIGL